MADKFRSTQEQNKWAAIESGAKASMDRIAQGKGSKQDLKNVSDALGKFNSLARNVFDEGVTAIEASAQNVLDLIHEDRKKKGKAPLTPEQTQKLFEQAVQRELFEFGPDLVETIQAMLDRRFEALEAHNKKAAEQFDKFASFTGQSMVTSHTMANILNDEAIRERRYDDNRWGRRLDGMATMMRDIVDDSIITFMGKFTGRNLSADGTPVGAPANEGYSPAGLASKFGGAANEEAQANGTTPTGDQTTVAPVVKLDPTTEDAVTQAANNKRSLGDFLSDRLRSLLEWKQKRDEKSEKEKADTWWHSFKTWVGDKYDKMKKSSKEGWISKIAKGLSLALLAPQIFDTIATKVKETLTWDNVVAAGQWVMNQIIDKGPDVLRWLGDVAIKGAVKAKELLVDGFTWAWEKLRMMLPKWAGGYSDEEKEARRKKIDAGPGASMKTDDPQTSIPAGSAAAAGGGGPGAAAGIVGPAPAASGTPIGSGGSTPPAAAGSSNMSSLISGPNVTANFGGANSTTTNINGSQSTSNTISGTTTPLFTAPGQPATTTEVKAATEVKDKDAPVTNAPETAAAAASPAGGGSGGGEVNKVGLGSFNISSGVDDSLLLMNAGLIA